MHVPTVFVKIVIGDALSTNPAAQDFTQSGEYISDREICVAEEPACKRGVSEGLGFRASGLRFRV